MNVLLISEDTLKTYSNLNRNTFGDWIMPAIRESQEMGLMPIIGECLYNKICELVADGSINDVLFTAYKDLLDDKIQPYLIYKTLSNIIPIINGKLANIGTVTTNDEHVVNLTQGEADLLKTYYSERCDFYTKRLQDFIKNNQSAFPEIVCGCGNMQPNLESSENSVGIWLGGSRGKMINDNKCGCSTSGVTCADYQSGFTDGVEFQKRKLQITAVTENGRYISEDGFKEIAVDVPTGHTDEELEEAYQDGVVYGTDMQKARLSAITLTQNGDYSREDGYSAVTVSVEQTGHTDEELEEAYESGYTSGYSSGYSSGYTRGDAEGYQSGVTHQKSLLTSLNITQNGDYSREDGYSSITVNVSGQEPSLVSTAVTVNGEYFPAQGYDGFSSVEVNVPQTGHTDQELADAYNSGKTDGVAEQKSKLSAITITENGNYNRIDGYSAVTVNVSSGNKINLTGDTNLTQYGRYYFDYDENTVIPSIKINFNVEIPSNYIKISLIDQTTSGWVSSTVVEGSGSGYTLDDLNLEYSYDGVSWNTWDYYGNKNIKLQENKHVYIRGNNPEHFSKNYTTYFKFRFGKEVSVCGNIMGLINYNNPPISIPNMTCFKNLFSGATQLVDVSNLSLPATVLTRNCYEGMFQGCTGITTAPELPATVLTQGCYNSMFRGCNSLNYIKCLATDVSATDCTTNWVFNVASSGTFVKNQNMNDWTSGVNGIPSNWTVVNNS